VCNINSARSAVCACEVNRKTSANLQHKLVADGIKSSRAEQRAATERDSGLHVSRKHNGQVNRKAIAAAGRMAAEIGMRREVTAAVRHRCGGIRWISSNNSAPQSKAPRSRSCRNSSCGKSGRANPAALRLHQGRRWRRRASFRDEEEDASRHCNSTAPVLQQHPVLSKRRFSVADRRRIVGRRICQFRLTHQEI
jgi:hypothetical protein